MSKKFLTLALLAVVAFSCKENNTEATPVTEPAATEVTTETSAPAQTTEQVQVQAQPAASNAGPFTNQQQAQPAATTGKTEPGFSGKPNPPHGQPGHRCDIQVGATLP